MSKISFDHNIHLMKLLLEEPFFSVISREIDKIQSSALPTAGVRFNEKTFNFELMYNQTFMSNCDEKQKLGVLKHEFYHIMFDHLTSRRPFQIPKDVEKLPKEEQKELSQKAKMWNYATDLAINSHLDDSELPYIKDEKDPTKLVCNPLKPGKHPFEKFPPLRTAEVYYDLLNNMSQEQKEKMFGGSEEEFVIQFDEHDWSGATDEQKEIIKEKMKALVRKAVKESAEGNRWGTLPNHIKEYAIELAKEGYIPWEKELSYFVKKTQKADKANTHKKVNKKYPYIHPGRKTNRHANICIAIDQSGSVSDELLAELTGPLNALSKIASFTVVPFDYEVCEKGIFRWKRGEHKRVKRVAGGGTCFDSVTKYVNDHKEYDGLIILTDLEAPKPISCRVQRMWITDEVHYARPYFQTNEKIAIVKLNGKALSS